MTFPMTLSKLAVLALTALILAGCQTPAERRAADEDKCLSYGFRRGSDAFAECLQRIDLDRRADLRSMRYDTRIALMRDRRIYYERPVYVGRPDDGRVNQRCRITPCGR